MKAPHDHVVSKGFPVMHAIDKCVRMMPEPGPKPGTPPGQPAPPPKPASVPKPGDIPEEPMAPTPHAPQPPPPEPLPPPTWGGLRASQAFRNRLNEG